MLEEWGFQEEYLLDGLPSHLSRMAAHSKVEVIALEPYAKMFSIGSEIRSAPLFCAPEVNTMGSEIGWFRALGLRVDVCTQSPDMLCDLFCEQACWSMVIIDCDSNGGIQHVLVQLKKDIRSDLKIPFVLVSRDLEAAVYWDAQSPMETKRLDHEFSIENMEETVFAVLDPS
jgi:hypothetical protein